MVICCLLFQFKQGVELSTDMTFEKAAGKLIDMNWTISSPFANENNYD